ncbi:MAG TPA: type II toxin-antitoxin system antitoxin SocA domain-containing protein [Methylocystis sp.]|jgi:uncharacterized phage-associated protein
MTTSCAPTSAAAAANEFLDLAWSESGIPPVDQMKLQKLLFYAHAWHLALKGTPLFEEDFEAWPWGPVVRDVYYETMPYGRAPITAHVTKLVQGHSSDKELEFVFVSPRVDDEETKKFIKSVWDAHKNYSGVQLSNATHATGEPWTVIKDKYNNNLCSKPTIPNDLIEAVFKKKLDNVKDTSA